MIDCDSFIDTARQRLKSLAPGQGLAIKTWKGDRQIILIKTAAGCTVIEDGFQRGHHDSVPDDKLKKLLKTLAKREFPRSNKLRLRQLTAAETEVLP